MNGRTNNRQRAGFLIKISSPLLHSQIQRFAISLVQCQRVFARNRNSIKTSRGFVNLLKQLFQSE